MRKLNKEQIVAVEKFAVILRKDYPSLRKGQAFYNALETLYPDVAKVINGMDIDPFYIDQNIRKCIEYISE